MTAKHHVSAASLTSGSRLVKNTLWNMLGLILPLLVGAIAMPSLIRELGLERFGVLTIIWMVIGYFSIFDFGLGRALTKLVAEKLGDESYEDIPGLIWAALLLVGILCIVSTVAVYLLADLIVFSWLSITSNLQAETLRSLKIMAFSIPFVISATAFRAVLEAYQKFAVINIIRVPLGLLTFLGPLVVLPFSTSLDVIVIVLLAGRICGAYAYYHYCVATVPAIKQACLVDKSLIRPLLGYGGWMTVTNLLGPLIAYIDRFLIGAVLTMSAVAYYVTPFEIVTKLWMIPMGMIGVLFPAFSTMLSSEREKVVDFFNQGTKIILYLMFPIFLIINMFAYEGMAFWIGKDFAQHSAPVMQWLSIGVFLNCVGRMPFILVQSAGRPDLIAKIFILELMPYVLVLWLVLQSFGLEGAAFVWMVRVLVDTVLMFVLSSKIVEGLGWSSLVTMVHLSVAVSILILVTFMQGIAVKVILLTILILLTLAIPWQFELSHAQRESVLDFLLNKIRKKV